MATEDVSGSPRVEDVQESVRVSFFRRALNGLRSAFTPKTCVSCSRPSCSTVAVPVLSSAAKEAEVVVEDVKVVEAVVEAVKEVEKKVEEAVKEVEKKVEEAVKEVEKKVEEAVKEVEKKVEEVEKKVEETEKKVEEVVVVAKETPAESTPPQEAPKSE